MKKTLLIFCSLIVFNYSYSQQLSGDILVSDFKHIVKLLEETHPDPYSGFGGKVFFHKEAFKLEQQLKNGTTLDDFNATILSFFSNMEDGHSYIQNSNAMNSSELILSLELSVISEGLIVTKITKDSEGFIGSKLLTINGITVAELAKRSGKLKPAENIYGKYTNLSVSIRQFGQMKRLIPEMKETVIIELEKPSGEVAQLQQTYLRKDIITSLVMTSSPRWGKVRDEYMYYDFLDKSNRVMYFRLSTVMAKESFSFMRKNGWGTLDSWLKNFYQYTLRKEMPKDVDKAIDDLPSIAEVFRQMIEVMKTNESEVLIIDLRGNGGGFTPIVLPTLYMLFGDEYLKKDMEIDEYRLISPLLMDKMTMTLEEFNKQGGTDYKFGDYSFKANNPKSDHSIEEMRKSFFHTAMGEAGSFISDLNGKPIYSPSKLFVITDNRTFSAAFHYTFYLWKMGATVVGIPSMQAPNTYMEGTPFELPLTKVQGSISNTFQQYLPVGNIRSKIFYPDIMLSWEDYQKYKFDKHTDILFLLDWLKSNCNR